MSVVFFIGVGVMLAMIGDPSDRATLRSTVSQNREHIFQPSWPKCKTPVSQQTMIAQANPDSSCQPVQKNAHGDPGPGKKGRYERK
jgi:hypothetical protein